MRRRLPRRRCAGGRRFAFGVGARMRSFRKLVTSVVAVALVLVAALARASEAELVLPDLHSVGFLGTDGWTLLFGLGVVICGLGLCFGLVQYVQLKNLPVHRAMRE